MLNLIGFEAEMVVARGSWVSIAVQSHVEGTSLKEGSEGKGVADSSGNGVGTVANDNAKDVMATFSVGTVKQGVIVVSSSQTAATGSSFGATALVGSSAKNG
jgi:hypothetical protein